MIKKLIGLLLVVAPMSTNACDICGCNLGGYSFGILSQNPTHFVGWKYSRSQFRASIDNSFIADEYSKDTYHRAELMGRLVIGKKWQLNAVIPYSVNVMDGNIEDALVSGLGDPLLIAYFNVFNTTSKGDRKFYHSLFSGGGLKLPFGKSDARSEEALINRNFQLGTGSLDYLASAIYTMKYRSWGMNFEGAYKINGINSDKYRFGNQTNLSAKVFYALIKPEYSLLPFIGWNQEEAGRHQAHGIWQTNTGGSMSFLSCGLQFFYSRWMMNIQYEWLAAQNFNTDRRSSITGDDRFTIGFYYNIPSAGGSRIDP